jgi:hypothetical protein
MTTATAEIPELQPVIPQKQMSLGGPGERRIEVGEKCLEMGAAFTHTTPGLVEWR